MATSSENPKSPTFSLKLVINRVVFAESDEDFLAVLLCLLKVPLATVSRLYCMNSTIGSIDNLYKSVEDLDIKYFNSSGYKELLLRPKIVAEADCNNLKMYDASVTDGYYNCVCSAAGAHPRQFYYSPYEGMLCRAGAGMNKRFVIGGRKTYSPLISGLTTFSITDDLIITPSSTDQVLVLTENFEDTIEFKDVVVGKEKIIKFVQQSFLGKMSLTSTFLPQQNYAIPSKVKKVQSSTEKGLPESEKGKQAVININILVDKRNDKIIYAESEQDFVEILLSFLTLPVGLVLHILRGNEDLSKIGSISNLYNSVDLLSSVGCLNANHRNMLMKPKLLNYFGIAVPDISQSVNHVDFGHQPMVLVKQRPLCESNVRLDDRYFEIKTNGGCLKKAKYMVTDELTVTPFCLSVSFSHLKKAGFHPQALEKRTLSIRPEQAKKLLHSCLTSKTALTRCISSLRRLQS